MDDTKLRRIERELEQTRNALHWQTKRCNHLVAALTLKLEQRDADVLATRHERETQLAQIMRALLVLEARLRREQRSIRAQLGSRDALIREQQLEIERLKKMIEPQRPVSPPESFRNDPVEEFDGSVKPDLISSLGIWQQTNNKPLKTALTSNGEQQLEEWQPANPSKNVETSKPPEHHLEESLGIWPNKPFKTPHTSKGEQHLEQPNNPSTNLEPSKTKSPNIEGFTTRKTEETLKMPEHHLQEFRSRTEETSIAEEHHLEELTNHDYREPLVRNGGSANPGNPLTTNVTNTTKFGHDEPLVSNGDRTNLGNPVIIEATNTTKYVPINDSSGDFGTTKYVPINDSSGDVGSSKFRPKTLSVNDCSTEDVETKGVGTNKYRQKGLLINGDLEDLTTKYRQKSLKVNGGGENLSSNNVKYMQKGLVLDGVVNDMTTTSYRPKKFEVEDVPKVTSPRQRKNGGGGTETSLERTPSSSSSSSTLSSTLSSLSSASSGSLMSASSSILKPSSFDDEEDDGLVDSSGGAAVERGKKEEKTVKISDIIQVRTHSDDLSECESSDSFTIIHDMKKAAEYRNGDVDAEVNTIKTLPSALLHEMQVQSKTGRNEYHDNPVLECVNQILLRDQEEFLEEQRVLRMRENEKSQSQENLNLVGRSSSRDDLTRLEQDKNLVVSRRMLQTTYNDKPPCLVTSSQLSLIGSVNFDEELNAVDVSSREQKSKQLKSVGKRSLIPPALPPKPLKLLSMRSPDFEASQQNLKSKQQSPQSKLPQKYDLDIRLLDNQPSCHPIIIGNASPALPEPNPDSELYVISNSALDDDLVQQIQGRNKKGGKELKNVLHPEQKGMNLTHALIHFPAGKNSGGKEVVGVSPGKFEDKRKTTPVKNMPVIKVASPVSTLLATSSVEGKGVEEEVVPSVSQMVKRFEHLSEEKVEGDGNTALSDNFDDGNSALRDNFEEFRLDDMDVICGVTAEEDNENKEPEKCLNGSVDTTTASVTVTPSEAGVSYENFLEATGLSQKSIMTPSRIFSNNHRNVLKPKDVKHRSRVKAANTISNPTVRYWTEPFL